MTGCSGQHFFGGRRLLFSTPFGGFLPYMLQVCLLGFVGSALQFAGAAVTALAPSSAGAQAAWLNGVLFIPPRNVQASKDLWELTEQHVLPRAGGVTVGGEVALKAGVRGQGVLVCRQSPTVQAVQMQWDKEEGRRAV